MQLATRRAKPLLTPETFDEFYCWLGMLGKQNGHRVESKPNVADIKDASIDLSRPRDLPLLQQVDISYHRRKFFRPPRLHLDKRQHIAVKRDQIDLTRNLNPLAVAANRHLKIRNDQPIAVLNKIFRRQRLAAFTESWDDLREFTYR